MKLLNPDYRADEVRQRLQDSYLYAGQAILARWPDGDVGPDQARDYLRQAQTAAAKSGPGCGDDRRPNCPIWISISTATAPCAARICRGAIESWRTLYDKRPRYLGGYLAEEIYRAYLTLAAQATADGDPMYPRQLYESALAMDVADTSEAESQLQGLTRPTPIPTPIPYPTPVYVAPPVAAAPPTATPTPVPSYQGWIAFRSTRDGGEAIYMMRADGSDQQRAPRKWRHALRSFMQSEQSAPDGRMAFVQTATGRSDADRRHPQRRWADGGDRHQLYRERV